MFRANTKILISRITPRLLPFAGSAHSHRLFSAQALPAFPSTNFTSIPSTDQMCKSVITHIANTNIAAFTDEDMKSKKLESRSMNDSYRQFRVPLSTDTAKRDIYLSANGNVRMGKLLEDLDHFAVHVSYVHNAQENNMDNVGTLPRTIVTASVHRIDFHRENLNPSRDIIIDGHISFAGTSSLEVSIRVFQHDDADNLSMVLKAKFFMVSRNPSDGSKKVRVHPLTARNCDEAALVSQAIETMKENSAKSKSSQTTNEELRVIHDIYEETVSRSEATSSMPVLKDYEIWLHKTETSNTELCFPEFQNMYGKIFGGFLMRKALELAHMNAKLFCKGQVSLRSMDDIVFAKPVEIGNTLHLRSHVSYTQDDFLQIKVEASTTDSKEFGDVEKKPSLCEEIRKVTNVFHFTMQSVNNKDILRVIPKHYSHAISYIEGRRHLQSALKRIVQ